ncbi:MAG: uracil-DNA glycosylase, partial [Acetobacter sp.]|nr:uracil-DNA glycosylase [Acetobacter sp.]
QLLDQALEEAGIIRKESYITNAVKHFRFIDKNGRRLHQKPDEKHVMACYPWLEAERRLVKPKVIVMLGATAAHSLLKRSVTIARERSRLFSIEGAEKGLVTIHPSYLLRLPDERAQQQEYDRFVSDLTLARRFVESC